MKINIKQLTKDELAAFFRELGQKPYRAGQILEWIYNRYALTFDEMTDLPKDLRETLKSMARISSLKLLKKEVSADATEKFLFGLEDGNSIESVLIPNNKGPAGYTLCISSQAGCAMGCKFCVTGGLGLKRNLKAHEIADQVTAVLRDKSGGTASNISNIVFMGMGEPFNNFSEVINALNTIMERMGYSKRKITVSTAGIAPRIRDFAEKAPGVNLAVSLNAADDDTRDMIMPANRKYPLKELMKACREFRLPPNRRITFEYVMIGGLNDSREDAAGLVKLLKGIRAKVNLIPYNPGRRLSGALKLKSPSAESVRVFHDILHSAGITSTIRKSMGSDISAACGQLKAAYKK